MNPNPVTQQEAAKFRAMLAAGMKVAEIAAITGWSKWAVYEHTKTKGRHLSSAQVAELVKLANAGLGRHDIAAITGQSYVTVRQYVGHLVPPRDQIRRPDIARYRRLVAAVESASYGERDGIAKRFGYKDAKVLKVKLAQVRKYLAALSAKEDRSSSTSILGETR